MSATSSIKFKQNAHHALQDHNLLRAMAKVQGRFVDKRAKAVAGVTDFEALRDAGVEIKNHTLAHLDLYYEEFASKLSAAGGQLHFAPTAADARRIIADICVQASAQKIVKGKSMVSEEIHLNDHLERAGFQVIETDLGEYIIQLRGERPSHIVAPAVHVSKEQVAENFFDAHRDLAKNRKLDTTRALVGEAREILRDHFLTADVGITGANFLIAETGSTVIVTNEGNGDLVQNLPRTHIVIASLEKMVPTLNDAATLIRLLGRSATGQPITVYTSFVTGCRRALDIEGPSATHVVILDNGRSQMLHSEFAEMLRCIRCGACMNHCPVYQAIGGHAYGWVYPGPMGAVLTPQFLGMTKSGDLPHASTLCGRCEEVCPMRIPLPDLLRKWRRRGFRDGHTGGWLSKFALKSWAFLAANPRLYHFVVGLTMPLTALLAGRKRYFSVMPGLQNWTRHRDLPAPAGRSFQQLWRQRQAGVE